MNLSTGNAVCVCVGGRVGEQNKMIMHVDYRPFGRHFNSWLFFFFFTRSFSPKNHCIITDPWGFRAELEFECEMSSSTWPAHYYPNQIILPSQTVTPTLKKCSTNKEILYTE